MVYIDHCTYANVLMSKGFADSTDEARVGRCQREWAPPIGAATSALLSFPYLERLLNVAKIDNQKCRKIFDKICRNPQCVPERNGQRTAASCEI